MLKKILYATMLAAAISGVPAEQAVARDIVVRVAPPAPRDEAMPAPRRGHTWVPGYWNWRGSRHAWVPGTWVRDRPGYRYRSPAWAERDGRWAFQGGRWSRGDRDGDGIPNRADRHPDNPRRP